jgi:hypothetical protein
LPSFSPAGSWPNADALPMAVMNPMQFWIQLAEQWQKACADAMSFWAKGGRSDGSDKLRSTHRTISLIAITDVVVPRMDRRVYGRRSDRQRLQQGIARIGIVMDSDLCRQIIR